MHAWRAPAMAAQGHRADHSRVALAHVQGPNEVADAVEERMRQRIPFESAHVELVDPEGLDRAAAIRLVSSSGDVSDIAALDGARNQNARYLLFGEVASRVRRAQPGEVRSGQRSPTLNGPAGEPQVHLVDGRLAMHWRVYDVATGVTIARHTHSFDADSAKKKYPDLEVFAGSETELLADAAARDAWQLVAPMVQTERARLALPWLTPGAATIRRGNLLAYQQQWPEAERQWQLALDRYPWSQAARHNLAIAAAAREDFAAARGLSQTAMKWWPSNHYKQSYVWLESLRRDYHQAHQLPDPVDGWPLSPPPPTSHDPNEVPRWTFWTWLTQPITTPW
jgi:hypothetical protein